MKETVLAMKHYDRDYNLFDPINLTVLLIVFFAFVIFVTASSNIVRAILFSYFLIGGISDILVNIVIGNIWSRQSLIDVGAVDKKKKLLLKLYQVSWMPRWIGILERFIFTTSFIIGKYEFIVGWLALKAIGSWKAGTNKQDLNNKDSRTELWRVRENIFLIGTALSLIFSFFTAFLYLQIINQRSNFFYKKSFQDQPKIIRVNRYYQNWSVIN